jgi:hypothetical protein
MPLPTVTATTQHRFDLLPELYREADRVEPSGGGWPLLRFLALLGDQAGDIEVLLDRFAYVPLEDGGAPGDTSDLVDPTTADAAWLAWLAQQIGIDPGDRTVAELRAAIADASTGWRAGSQAAVRSEVQTQLTGAKHVGIWDHWENDEWRVAIGTRHVETADEAAVLVAANRTKPAGVQFEHVWGVGTWADFEAAGGTWADFENPAGPWDTTWDAYEDVI